MKITKVRALNINSLKGSFEIDFEQFLQEDALFAITGPTGAGKSSLLDIITCALYARTLRLTNPNELMSRHTGECLCEVEFEIKKELYRSSWSQKRARKKADGKFQTAKMELSLVSSGKILEAKLREVPKYIEKLSGLDFERFKQSMLLAQGSFDAFLRAKESERSSLLEKITGTSIYARLSKEVYENYAKEKKAIELEESKLGATELLSPEQKTEKEQEQKALEESLAKIAEVLKSLREQKSFTEKKVQLDKALLMQTKAFEEAQKEKEAKSKSFSTLSLAKKALGLEAEFTSLESLEKSFLVHKEEESVLTKSLETLRENISSSEQNFQRLSQEFAQTKTTFEVESKKLEAFKLLSKEYEGLVEQVNVLTKTLATKEAQKTEQTTRLEQTLKSISLLEQEQKSLEIYLKENSKLEALKEQLLVCEQEVLTHKVLEEEVGQLEKELKLTNQECSLLEESLKTKEVQVVKSKEAFVLCEQAFTALSLPSAKEEEQERAELKEVLEQLRFAKELEKIDVSLQKEQTLLESLELEVLEKEYTQKNRLVEELQEHLKSLQAKKETELLVLNYEQERQKLKSGEPCFLCGSKKHPYINHALEVNIDETSKAIKEKETVFTQENKALQALLQALSSAKTKEQTSLLEKEKLLDEKKCLETLFKGIKRDVLEKREASLEQSLQALIQQREKKELLAQEKEQAHKTLLKQEESLNQDKQTLEKLSFAKTNVEKNIAEVESKKEHLSKKLKTFLKTYALQEPFTKALESLQTSFKEYEKTEQKTQNLGVKQQALLLEQAEQSSSLAVLQNTLRESQKSLASLRSKQETLKQEQKALLAVEDVLAYEQELLSLFESVQTKHAHAEKMLASYKTQQEASLTQQKALAVKLEEERKRLDLLEKNFHKTLLESGFQNKQAFQEALLEKDAYEHLEQQCKALEERYVQSKTLLENTQEALRVYEGKEVGELESLSEQLVEQEERFNNTQKSLGSLEKELELDAMRANKHEQSLKALAKQKEAFYVWVKLAEMVGSADGTKFAKYAQGITLDQLIYLANQHLQRLSPRYELQRSLEANKLLEIEIIDAFQGNSVRAVHTLSGGESFIVSLALALGLSALASQKIAIDSLFLDEGFGTLDAQSLELALNALNMLQSEGKMVGVISHVEALKERIALQIKVKPRGDGTSFIELT